MGKTTVPSRNLANMVDPTTREYINARIHEEIKLIGDDTSGLGDALSKMRTESEIELGEMKARINEVEEILSLSGAKISRIKELMEELDG